MFPSNVSMVWTTSHVTPDSVVWHLQGNESKFMMAHCCAFSPSTRRTWDSGCLPFTWANHSVHGVGKWFAILRTGKFRPGIAFTMCTNYVHLPKNGREGLKLVSEMALKNWNTNSLPIQTFRFLRKFSNETTQKVVFYLLSNRIGKLFVNLNTHNSVPCASRRRLGTSQRLYKIITDPNFFKFWTNTIAMNNPG